MLHTRVDAALNRTGAPTSRVWRVAPEKLRSRSRRRTIGKSASSDNVDISRRGLVLGGAVLLGTAAGRSARAADAPVILKEGSRGTTQRFGFEDRISEFTLPNGMHFIVLERPDVPVVSINMYANVGAYDEEDGQTGLAHLLEHMAFKGTRRVGGRDWEAERVQLDDLDAVFYELRAVSAAEGPRSARATALRAKLAELQARADELVVANAYGALLTQQGGVGLNATTSHDSTRYFVALPANKLELWFALEAERFRAPVFRGLYSEKKVIEEERRLRVDDAPLGRYQQEYAMRALANNYRRPIIGYAEDFVGLGRREVANFFAQHYGPRSLTVALVGDVKPEQARRLAEQYWGGWTGARISPVTSSPNIISGGPFTSSTGSSVPSASGNSRVRLDGVAVGGRPWDRFYRDFAPAGPLVLLGFPRPALLGPQGTLTQVACDVLGGSRSTRLLGRAVLGRGSQGGPQLLGAGVVAGYPGEARPGLALVSAVPIQGSTVEAAEDVVWGEIQDLVEGGGPSAAELSRIQKETRVGVMGAALSNSSMASLLTSYHVLTGSWRGLLDELAVVRDATPAAVREAAASVFSPDAVFTGHVIRKV